MYEFIHENNVQVTRKKNFGLIQTTAASSWENSWEKEMFCPLLTLVHLLSLGMKESTTRVNLKQQPSLSLLVDT